MDTVLNNQLEPFDTLQFLSIFFFEGNLWIKTTEDTAKQCQLDTMYSTNAIINLVIPYVEKSFTGVYVMVIHNQGGHRKNKEN